MPLVEALARRHDRRGAEHDDLVQAGSIGLLNAIERFDPKRGEEFVAFAVPTVEGEMKRHIRDRTGAVRLPRRLHEARERLPGVRDEITARLGRAPAHAELARELGISDEDLANLERTTTSAADQAAPEEDPTGDLDASESRLLLAGAFESLDDTDRRILYLRFVRELSRREVADQVGMSQSALTRRTNAALAKVRAELEGRAFKPSAPGAKAAPEPTPPPEPTPQPEPKAEHSGRLMLRMPQSLHTELARAAEREEVSLNQFITNTLSAAMHWHTENKPPPPPPRWLPAAVVTNIVVVVIAGVIAVVLLIVAWQQGW